MRLIVLLLLMLLLHMIMILLVMMLILLLLMLLIALLILPLLRVLCLVICLLIGIIIIVRTIRIDCRQQYECRRLLQFHFLLLHFLFHFGVEQNRTFSLLLWCDTFPFCSISFVAAVGAMRLCLPNQLENELELL